MDKCLYLVRGLPGSGKTTLVESLKRPGDFAVAADDFRIDSGGRYVFSLATKEEVYKKCLDAAGSAMAAGVPCVFVHNTFSETREIEPYFAVAEKYSYTVFSIIIENRHDGKSSHGVPASVIEEKRESFQIQL